MHKKITLLTALLVISAMVLAEESKKYDIDVDSTQTISIIASSNRVPADKLLKGLKLDSGFGSSTLTQAGRTTAQAEKIVRRIKVLQAAEQSKNWKLILSKFVWWILALGGATYLLIKKKTNWKLRLAWMAGAALFFGFLYGSDPNPMGTIKDAVVLLGREGVMFPPRLVAMTVFLVMVWISNKSICGWGCHFGAVQDVLHNIPTKKFKLPFVLTNTLRLIVFLSIAILALGWKMDWVGGIDPFKIFNWRTWDLTAAGLLFVVLILALGFFFYRPWCQMFCPFGMMGWIIEQFSLLRPRIYREKCRKCMKCVEVCPNMAMDGIYHGKKLRADCFACGRCIEQCPAKVINWKSKTSDKETK
jgi:NAD-dependent dihydropyrimidine dehydrogenase PreA subunit